jgi:hypothetical protein
MVTVESGRVFSNKTTWFVLGLIALAGLLYWFVWDEAPVMTRDSNDYLDVAVDLGDGRLDEVHFRAPGYPLLLLLMGSAREPSRSLYLVQLFFHFVSVLLIALFFIRIGLHRIFILLFMVLASLPPSVVLTAYVLTEALSEFLVVTGTVSLLFYLWKGRTALEKLLPVLSGLAFGLAAVIKPTFQLLFLLICGIMLLFLRFGRVDRRTWLPAVIALFTIPLVIIGGLYAYNFGKLGYLGLTPSFGFHFSTKTARVVERLPDEYSDVREMLISKRDTILVERHGRHSGANYIWLARPELEQITGLDKPGLSRYLVRMNLVLIKRAPLQYMKEVAAAMTQYWFPATTTLSNFDSRLLQLLWSAIHFITIFAFLAVIFLLVSLISARWYLNVGAGKIRLPKSERAVALLPAFIIPLAIIIYTMLVSTLFEAGHQRYRIPTDLLIYFFTVLGIHFLIELRTAASEGITAHE